VKARIATLLTAVLLLALLVSACGAPATPAPEATTPPEATTAPEATTPPEPPPEGPSGSIVIVIGNDPSTLDPQYADDGNEHKINDNVYEHLLTRDPATGEILPELAESWEQIDDTTWRFHLREGIQFHNGEPFSADAVVFSAERIIDPEFNSEQISFVASITGGEAVDEYTVDIFTDGPDPTLPARMTWLKIVPPVYAAEDPDQFAQAPVGTGPYKFVEWVRGSYVTLEANEDYWGGAPDIKEVTWRPIEEAATRLAALQAGEVDIVTDLIPEYLPQVEKSVAVPGLEFSWIRINCNVEPTNDVRVRQALNYALDKDALVDALYGGYAVKAEGQILTPGHFGYNPDVKAYPYDPEKARDLLEEAGASGATLELIGESGRWLKDKELVEAVAMQLEAVGLDIDVNIVEWSDWLDLLFAGAAAAPDLQYSSHDNVLLDADRTLSALFTTDGSQSAYSNPRVDELVLDARTETDVELRAQMYHEAVQIIRDDAACIFTVNLDNIYGLSENLEWTPRLDGRIFVKDMTLND
jgi:peptide/nickel transport system substrate-binding protein